MPKSRNTSVQTYYKTFKGTAISSWQEGIEDNTIVLHNQKYA